MTMRIVPLALMVAGACLIAAAEVVVRDPWLVWNTSASLPVGLYRVRAADGLADGDVVVVRPPSAFAPLFAERGYLPAGTPLLKRIAAGAGDTVCRDGLQVTIDGVAAGHARERDRFGRCLPIWQGCRALGSGEVFLMNRDVPDSLDGRYFGPVSITSVIGRADPLWTLEEAQ
jgi:conjugative transfer signal peptidase TraF